MRGIRGGRTGGVAVAGCVVAAFVVIAGSAVAQQTPTLAPSVMARVDAATFEVVAAKPTSDPLTYAKPLPLDLLPYQERTDKYHSIGTAFAIGPNRYVTAGHVLLTGLNSLWGPLALRDDSGHVYAIDRIEKFALRKDFVVFSLVDPPADAGALPIDQHPTLNQAVYAVGNALGTGVVVRSGLYTSDTPEQQSGAWKWMRFSAAASPGNSGGPLLDQNGNVIGVVTMKSPNENLNYALPISEVLDAPANLATIDKRLTTQTDLSFSSYVGGFKAQFALPETLANFDARMLQLEDANEDAELKALLAQQHGALFPDGDGSDPILHEVLPPHPQPALLDRSRDGQWRLTGWTGVHESQLPDNGYFRTTSDGKNVLFHLRRPDSVPAATLYADPETLMNLIAQTGGIRRKVGTEWVRVTSLGKPTRDEGFTDRWGRHWHLLVWPIPAANRMTMLAVLPVPDGYAGILRDTEAHNEHWGTDLLETYADYVVVDYDGTLAQWKDFLAESALLPEAFKAIHVVFDYGRDFSYSSPRLAFSFTPALQKIAADSTLDLGFNFARVGGKVVWGVDVVRVQPALDTHDWVSFQRHPAPSPDLPDTFQVQWNRMRSGSLPWNGAEQTGNGHTRAFRVVRSGNPQPRVLYGAVLGREGALSQKQVDAQFDLLMQHVEVDEPGYAMAVGNLPANNRSH